MNKAFLNYCIGDIKYACNFSFFPFFFNGISLHNRVQKMRCTFSLLCYFWSFTQLLELFSSKYLRELSSLHIFTLPAFLNNKASHFSIIFNIFLSFIWKHFKFNFGLCAIQNALKYLSRFHFILTNRLQFPISSRNNTKFFTLDFLICAQVLSKYLLYSHFAFGFLQTFHLCKLMRSHVVRNAPEANYEYSVTFLYNIDVSLCTIRGRMFIFNFFVLPFDSLCSLFLSDFLFSLSVFFSSQFLVLTPLRQSTLCHLIPLHYLWFYRQNSLVCWDALF